MKTAITALVVAAALLIISLTAFDGAATSSAHDVVLPDIVITE